MPNLHPAAARCSSPSPDCDRERRWNAKRGGWLWHCAKCERVFPDNTDGSPSSIPLRGDPDPSVLCPLCSSPMVPVRGTRNGDFWSCSRHPRCKGKRQASPIQEPAK